MRTSDLHLIFIIHEGKVNTKGEKPIKVPPTKTTLRYIARKQQKTMQLILLLAMHWHKG